MLEDWVCVELSYEGNIIFVYFQECAFGLYFGVVATCELLR